MTRRRGGADGPRDGDGALPGEFVATGLPLGEGATSVVWPARHRIDGGDVALKVWRTPLATERDRTRFLSEARQHRKIAATTPYVVRYVTSGLRDGRYPWIATARHGTALDRVLAARGRFGLEDGAVVAHDILAGLAAVHRAGSVHRDVKPGNVLVDRGRARLCDLGLVMRDGAFTQDAQAGTPSYVAPDLRAPGAVPTPGTDVHSAAVTIRELLPDAVPDGIDQVLSDAGTGCDRRPADGQEFLDRFAEACRTAGFPIDGLPAPEDAAAAGDGDGPDDDGGPFPDDVPRPRHWARWAAAAAAVVALAVGTGAAGLLDRPDGGSGPAGQASEDPAPDEGADGFARSEEAADAVRAAVPDPSVEARGTNRGDCEPGGGMTRQTAIEHFPAGGGPPLAVSEVLWTPGTGEACVRLHKRPESPLHDTPSYLALTLCGSPGRCDTDRSAFERYAGPLRSASPNGCFAWAVAVSESPDPDSPFAVEETHDFGCD